MEMILCSDNPVTRDLVRTVLGPEDRLTVCETGMELLAAVKAIASDLVILDLQTHGLGGQLLISAVYELAPDAPIVAVSQDGAVDARPLLQRGIPYFRLGTGDGDGADALRLHVHSRGQGTMRAPSASAA